ncbi:lysosomal proton-coupled steroid conjugate and bile acid symporter SLC46A3-like [Choristoneura fumiferana]|uniref:lysosomal proton-coupled steroid conjugate and bile acid symporter SLC46A3-like n=1 Tax=Choristoneura fumiferana TaxID=7141 RepID=UPI003D154736
MSMLGSLSPPLIRSQITKVVPNEEVSKLYALISCMEAVVPIFSPILFNTVYFATLAYYPGAVYVISACLFTACLIFVSIAEVLYYKTLGNQDQDRTLLIEE